MKLLLLVFFAASFQLVFSGRILAISGVEVNSHYVVFSAVVDYLAANHNITFYVDPKFNYKNPKVKVKTLLAPYRFLHINLTEKLSNVCTIDSFEVFYYHILSTNRKFFDLIYTINNITEIIQSNETYDLILMNGAGTDHYFQIAHVLNLPIILVTPSISFPWFNDAVNNPYSWVNDLNFANPEYDDTFKGRLQKFIRNGCIHFKYYFQHLPVVNSVTKLYFPPGTPPIQEVFNKIALLLINTNDAMGYSKPRIPTVVPIGTIHIKPSKPLPADIDEFISGAKEHGFIYFSLGTFIEETVLSKNLLKIFLNTFKKLPQRVLWKWNGIIPDVPSNVKIAKWFPQNDVLADPRIKLFIQQGGMLSTQEAVYNGVPVLLFPVIFDQFTNAFVAEQRGFGKSLKLCHLTEELFYDSIKELIYNESYKENVEVISKLLQSEREQISFSLNKWIDFVLRYKGTKNLRPILPYNLWFDLPVDICLFFLILLFLIIYFVKFLCTCIYAVYEYIRFYQYKGKLKVA